MTKNAITSSSAEIETSTQEKSAAAIAKLKLLPNHVPQLLGYLQSGLAAELKMTFRRYDFKDLTALIPYLSYLFPQSNDPVYGDTLVRYVRKNCTVDWIPTLLVLLDLGLDVSPGVKDEITNEYQSRRYYVDDIRKYAAQRPRHAAASSSSGADHSSSADAAAPARIITMQTEAQAERVENLRVGNGINVYFEQYARYYSGDIVAVTDKEITVHFADDHTFRAFDKATLNFKYLRERPTTRDKYLYDGKNTFYLPCNANVPCEVLGGKVTSKTYKSKLSSNSSAAAATYGVSAAPSAVQIQATAPTYVTSSVSASASQSRGTGTPPTPNSTASARSLQALAEAAAIVQPVTAVPPSAETPVAPVPAITPSANVHFGAPTVVFSAQQQKDAPDRPSKKARLAAIVEQREQMLAQLAKLQEEEAAMAQRIDEAARAEVQEDVGAVQTDLVAVRDTIRNTTARFNTTVNRLKDLQEKISTLPAGIHAFAQQQVAGLDPSGFGLRNDVVALNMAVNSFIKLLAQFSTATATTSAAPAASSSSSAPGFVVRTPVVKGPGQ